MVTNENPMIGGHGFGDTTNHANKVHMGDTVIHNHHCPLDPSVEEARRAANLIWEAAPTIKMAVDERSLSFQFLWNNASSVARHPHAEEQRTGRASPSDASITHTTRKREVDINEKGAENRAQVMRNMRRDDSFMDETKEGNPDRTYCDFAVSFERFMRETGEQAKCVGSYPGHSTRRCHAEFFSILHENSNVVENKSERQQKLYAGKIEWTSYRPRPDWHSDTWGKSDRTSGLQESKPSPSRPRRSSSSKIRHTSSGSRYQNSPTAGTGLTSSPGRYPGPSSSKGSPATVEDIGDPPINKAYPEHKSRSLSSRRGHSTDVETDILPKRQPRSSRETTSRPASSGFTMNQTNGLASSATRNVNQNRHGEHRRSRSVEIIEKRSTTRAVSGAREQSATRLIHEAKTREPRLLRRMGILFHRGEYGK